MGHIQQREAGAKWDVITPMSATHGAAGALGLLRLLCHVLVPLSPASANPSLGVCTGENTRGFLQVEEKPISVRSHRAGNVFLGIKPGEQQRAHRRCKLWGFCGWGRCSPCLSLPSVLTAVPESLSETQIAFNVLQHVGVTSEVSNSP